MQSIARGADRSQQCWLVVQPHPIDDSQKTIEQIEPGRTIAEELRARTPEGAGKLSWTVRLNGEVLPEDKHDHVIALGDHVSARLLPKPQAIVGAIIFIAKAVLYAAISYGISVLANKIFGPKPPSKNRARTSADPFYSLSGSRNELRRGGALQTHYGRMRVVPDLLLPPVSRLGPDGKLTVQYVYCVGQGSYDISDIRLANTPIADFDPQLLQIYEGNGVGTPSSTLTGFTTNINEESVQLDLLNRVGNSEQLIRTTANDCKGFTVVGAFSRGIWRVGRNGKNYPTSVRIVVDYRVTGTGPWTRGYDEVITIQTYTPLTRNISVVNLAEAQYDVAVQLIDVVGPGGHMPERGGDGNTPACAGDYTWLALQSYLDGRPFDDDELSDCTIFGISLQASDRLSGALDQINCIAQRRLYVFDGDVWTANVETRSPAWAMVDPLIRRDGFDAIDADEILRWAEYCTEQEWEFNHSFNDAGAIRIGEFCQMAAACGQADYVRKGPVHSIALDELKSAPVAIFTGDKIQDLQVIRNDLDPLHAVHASFVNEDAGYNLDELTVYLDGYDQDTAEEYQQLEIIPGITNANQLQRHILRELARRQLRTRVYTFRDALPDGLVLSKGDMFELCHGRALLGQNDVRVLEYAVDVNDKITDIVLSEPVTMEAGVEYGLRVALRDGSLTTIPLFNPLTAGIQTSNLVTAEEDVDPPTYLNDAEAPVVDTLEDAFAAFGELGSETVQLIVTEIRHDRSLLASITATTYSPEIQTADSVPIPGHTPVTGRIVAERDAMCATPQLGNVRAEYRGVNQFGAPRVDIIVPVTAGPVERGDQPTAHYRMQWRIVGATGVAEEWKTEPTVESIVNELVIRDIAGAQTIDVRVYGITRYGVVSDPAFSLGIQTEGGVEFPKRVTITPLAAFDALGGARTNIRIAWDYDTPQPEPDTAIRYKLNFGEWRDLGTIAGANEFLFENADPGEYLFELRGRLYGLLSTAIEREAFVFAPTDTPSSPAPTGLELLIAGQRGGASREFVGRSVGIIWNPINFDESLHGFEGAGEVPPDSMISEWLVRVRDPQTGETIREERIEATFNSYVYAYDQHAEDGLRRSIRFDLYFRDRAGNLSAPAVLVASNTAPEAPTGVLIEPTVGSVYVSADRPLDPDLDVLLVWASDTPGFTADPSNLVATGGTGTNDVSFFWDPGATVYLRLAWADAFSRDIADLNLSAEQSADVPEGITDDERSGLSGAYFNSFEGSLINHVVVPDPDGTFDVDGDAFGGDQAGLFTWSGSPTPSDTADETPYIQLPFRAALSITDQRVRVLLHLKKPTGGAASVRVALDCGAAGSSGWQTFAPTTSYALYKFLFKVGTVNDPTACKLRIQGNAGLLVDSVAILVIQEAVTSANRDTHLGDEVITTPKITANAASAMYENTETGFNLFTGSDEATWKEIVTLEDVVVVGQAGGGSSPIIVNAVFEGDVQGLYGGGGVVAINAPKPGSLPRLTWRLIRDKGTGSETTVYTSGEQTISAPGYGIGGATNPIDLVGAGTHTYTLEARWDNKFYTEGTAKFDDAGGGAFAIITGSGTRWGEFVNDSMEIRIPSLSATWHPIGSVTSNTRLTLEATHGMGVTGFGVYELRHDSTEVSPIVILDISKARIQVTELRR